jgi:hypothetical protein
MNPEIMRMLMNERDREARVRAERGRNVRALLKAKRARRRDDNVLIPPIPDYVDGSFRAGDDAIEARPHASQRHSHASQH